jgi:pilus assembly protein CpaF
MPHSLDIILPFLKPIGPWLNDATVSEIMINGPDLVFVEQSGCIRRLEDVRIPPQHLLAAAKHIARAVQDDVHEDRPLLDARLADGSRVAVALPPVSVNGITMTIRRFGYRRYTPYQLQEIGMLSADMSTQLRQAIARRENIVISGGTGSGKTTLLQALAMWIPAHERILLIEDTAELALSHTNLVRFEARRANDTAPAVTIRELVRASLRHRPDRLIVGETRGSEALDLVQAMNTGHDGSFTTIHAHAVTTVPDRLATCALQAGDALPYDALLRQIAQCVQWIVQVQRSTAENANGQRIVRELARVDGFDSTTKQIRLTTVIASDAASS